jgi:predicted PolB exonuclease-like 3'-5' exonuclease
MPPAPSYLVLDIETIPDRALWTPPEPGPGGERAFPPLYACRPVVLGVLLLDQELRCERLGTLGAAADEAGMLATFADLVEARRPQLISWNGRGFDLPVLVLRSLRQGLAWPWYYGEGEYRNRRSEVAHLDLGDALADHGAARMTSLDGASRLIGLPGKDGVDGSQVEGMFEAGQLEALDRYCLCDVTQTAFLFLRYRLLAGQLPRAAYTRAATALLDALAADGRVARVTDRVDRARLLLA